MKAFIEKAGKYKVEYIDCPNFTNSVKLNAPRAGILHTTEGGWAGSMAVFGKHYAPHFIVGEGRIAQLVPVGLIGAALVTNNDLAIVQIEMVSFSKETPWLPDEKTLDALASLMIVCRDEYGIPLSRPFKDGEWGKAGNNANRKSNKFGKVAGWFGHGDVNPGKDSHWDPGNLEFGKIFEYAKKLETKIPLIDEKQTIEKKSISEMTKDEAILEAKKLITTSGWSDSYERLGELKKIIDAS